MARDSVALAGFASTLGITPEEFLGDERTVIETLQTLRKQCPHNMAADKWIRDQIVALWGIGWTMCEINQTIHTLIARNFLKYVPNASGILRFSSSRI